MRNLSSAVPLVAVVLAGCAGTTSAPTPSPQAASNARGRLPDASAAPKNYVFFSRDHDRIAEASFLQHAQIAGAQLTYTWRELEPQRDRYDLQPLRDRLAFLERHGKRLRAAASAGCKVP